MNSKYCVQLINNGKRIISNQDITLLLLQVVKIYKEWIFNLVNFCGHTYFQLILIYISQYEGFERDENFQGFVSVELFKSSMIYILNDFSNQEFKIYEE